MTKKLILKSAGVLTLNLNVFFNNDYVWNKLMNKCTAFCYLTLDLSIPRKIE